MSVTAVLKCVLNSERESRGALGRVAARRVIMLTADGRLLGFAQKSGQYQSAK